MNEEQVKPVGYFKGRGAQLNIDSRFNALQYVEEHIEGLDEPFLRRRKNAGAV